MKRIIWVKSEGNGDTKLLVDEILKLNEEFSKEGIEIRKEKSLEFGALGKGVVIITILGWIAQPLISKLINKIYEKKEDIKNVNQININIKIYNG